MEELDVTSPRLEEYQRIINSGSDEPELHKAQSILSKIVDINKRSFSAGGPGFRITAQRLALASSFITYDAENDS
ncbi:MAG: hypothetical protein AAGD25_35455 [Cyanobacteria bacterium P01_F01_bin.150]